MSPDEAMQELLTGNPRTIDNQLTSIQQDPTVLREHTVDKPEPRSSHRENAGSAGQP